MRDLVIVLVCLTVLAAAPVYGQPWVEVYNPFEVLTLNLEMADEDWDTIRRDTTNEIEVRAMFWAAGGPEPPLEVSVRRKSSRALPSEGNPIKVGLKVDINEFVRGQLWRGLTKLSLENGADTDPISEGFAWNLHELGSVEGFYGNGYHAGLASWVRVVVNGTYIGLYISVEERDAQFLRNRGLFFEDKTWLYEIDDLGAGSFELEVGDPHSPTYQALCYSPFTVGNKKNPPCPTPNNAALETDLPTLIDMQVMLTQGAIDAFSSNNDALFTHGKNFRFADFDPSLGAGLRRLYYVWDLDGAITNLSANIYAQKSQKGFTQTPYQFWILNHPRFREDYNSIMTGLLNSAGPLSETAQHSFLSAVEIAVTLALASDPYAGFGSAAGVASHFSALRKWVTQRIGIVLNQVLANQPPPRS